MEKLAPALPTRRRVLGWAAGGIAAAAFGTPTSARAELPGPMAPGVPLEFDIVALGIHIGSHKVEFAGSGDDFSATSTIDVDAQLLGVRLLRYFQVTSEAWSGGRLQSFRTEGDENGDSFHASGRAVADGFEIEGRDGRLMAPRDTVLATCWSPLMLLRHEVINPKRGRLKPQTVESTDHTTFVVGDEKLPVTRYVVDSVIDGTIYYDDRQTWVGAAFDRRGATINYVRR
jgi:hypothetical protein